MENEKRCLSLEAVQYELIIWEETCSYDTIWPFVLCCNDGSIGVMIVTSWSALGTTCSAWDITGIILVIWGTSNAFEGPIPFGYVFRHISE